MQLFIEASSNLSKGSGCDYIKSADDKVCSNRVLR